jgi:methylmalonyl-CoA mutase N-terminal domain/subunit
MHIDDFAPNLSFFFSNGMDPEYTVMGRVARRIWAVAMKEKYGANERSQKLKYHIQTSGRSLHAQEIDFNDIRTTLQALIAIYDNCNSCTPTPTTRPSPRRPKNRCAARWRSSSSSTANGAWPRTRTPTRAPSSSRS